MTQKSLSPSPAPSSPARKRRKAERPAEIVEAGMAEFARNGFARTRLEDVARRAGVAKGTLYLYFPDKEALFLAAVRSRMGATFAQAEAAFDAFQGPTIELMRAIVRMIHAQILQGDVLPIIRIVLAEGAHFPELTALYYAETVAKGRALLARVVARGRARGEIADGPVADLPESVMAPAIMALFWRIAFEAIAPIAAERFLAAHLAVMEAALFGVAPPSSPPAPIDPPSAPPIAPLPRGAQ
jgi:AcrR family transcriptional regulator